MFLEKKKINTDPLLCIKQFAISIGLIISRLERVVASHKTCAQTSRKH